MDEREGRGRQGAGAIIHILRRCINKSKIRQAVSHTKVFIDVVWYDIIDEIEVLRRVEIVELILHGSLCHKSTLLPFTTTLEPQSPLTIHRSPRSPLSVF